MTKRQIILDSFNGCVEFIRDGMADIIWENSDGRYDTTIKLNRLPVADGRPVKEGDCLAMKIYMVGRRPRLKISYIPPRDLTEADYQTIQQRLKEAFPDPIFRYEV